MKVFVTGATGFVGSHFLKAALFGPNEVLALRRSPNSATRIPLEKQPEWIERPMDEVSASDLKGVDAIVHFAAHTPNVPYDTIENCLHWNVTVPLSLFRQAMSVGVRRFVIAGSCFEYGRSGERYEFIPTDAPLEATLSYPLSKAVASRVFAAFAAETGARVSIHRIFQVFGPGESEHRLWPSLRRAAIAGEDFQASPGEQVRDFISVESVADHFLSACYCDDVDPSQTPIYHVGTGKPQTIADFTRTWWRRWEASGKVNFGALPYRDGEVMRYVPEVENQALSRNPNL